MKYLSVGLDTETCEGKPFSLQFSSDVLGDEIIFCNEKNATKKFFEYLTNLLTETDEETIIVFGCHNLEYDAVSLFYKHRPIFLKESFVFEVSDFRIEGVFSNVVFFNITYKNRQIWILDTFAYFKTSLKKLGEMLAPDLPKLEKPNNLGKEIFTEEDKEFCAYAIRDAVIGKIAMEFIIKQHLEYKVSIAVSAPHFASKVFRKNYLKEPIPLPNKSIVFSSLHSYHGGKNNLTVEPGWHDDVYSLDIVSAYPHAMTYLPDFSDKSLYKKIECEDSEDKALACFPEYGVYKVYGEMIQTEYPIFYNHAFKPLVDQQIKGIWITGFELNQAIRSEHFSLEKLYGYYYDTPYQEYPDSPFYKYSHHFFSEKDKSDSKIMREFNKLLLNSLYGKFIQTIKERDFMQYKDLSYDTSQEKVISEKSIIAGGLFNPFIATLITGFVRARIHELELEYGAIHTATDGIFTHVKPKEVEGLGGLKIDAFGDLLLFRNKCYIMYASKPWPGRTCIKSTLFKNRYIIKYAHHGFFGSIFDLERMYITGEREYTYTKPNKLRESFRRGLDVNKFETRKGTLKLK